MYRRVLPLLTSSQPRRLIHCRCAHIYPTRFFYSTYTKTVPNCSKSNHLKRQRNDESSRWTCTVREPRRVRSRAVRSISSVAVDLCYNGVSCRLTSDKAQFTAVPYASVGSANLTALMLGLNLTLTTSLSTKEPRCCRLRCSPPSIACARHATHKSTETCFCCQSRSRTVGLQSDGIRSFSNLRVVMLSVQYAFRLGTYSVSTSAAVHGCRPPCGGTSTITAPYFSTPSADRNHAVVRRRCK